MSKPGPAQTPITARIKRTTKGGITQPILNMGAPVQMKAPSIAKQITGKLKPGEGVLKPKEKSAAGNFEPAGKQKDFIPFAFRQDAKIGGGSNSGIKGKAGSAKRKAEYDAKGWAYDETISKASTIKPKAKVANTLKAKKGIDTKVARTTSLETKLDPKVLKTQVAEINSKKSEPSKQGVRKAVRKTKSADRKDDRAARVRQKGIDALASGDKKKALRLRKRETRIKKRAAKKRDQAANAIDPTK